MTAVVKHRHAAWRHQHRAGECAGCRAAYNRRARDRRRKRWAQRVQRDGRWIAARPGLTHGQSSSTYNNWGCRCVPCSAAKRAER